MERLNRQLRHFIAGRGNVEKLRLWCKECVEAGAAFAKIPVSQIWEQ